MSNNVSPTSTDVDEVDGKIASSLKEASSNRTSRMAQTGKWRKSHGTQRSNGKKVHTLASPPHLMRKDFGWLPIALDCVFGEQISPTDYGHCGFDFVATNGGKMTSGVTDFVLA